MARSRSLALVLAGVVALVGALVSPAVAAGGTAGTLKTSVSTVTARGDVSFVAGFPTRVRRPVVLQRWTLSGWVRVAAGRTNRRGIEVFATHAPARPGRFTYRARARRTSTDSRVLRALTTPVTRLTVTALPDGTLLHPYGIGTEFVNGGWRFSLAATDTDAWQWLQYGDPVNGKPPGAPPLTGWSYITVPVTYTNLTAGPRTPMTATDIDFLGSDGFVYDELSGGQSCGPVSGGVGNVILVAPNFPITAVECAVAPTAAIRGGLWRVSGDETSPQRTFVKTG